MKRDNLRIMTALVLTLIMLAPYGCILDPEEEPLPPDPIDPVYKPLTDKENVIDNLLLSYKNKEIDPYEELLHDDYLWYMQAGDLEPGEQPMIVREDDIRMTKAVFDNAVRLELLIFPASWQEVYFIGEEPCDDCWKTERNYRITAQFDPEGTVYNGDDNVEFIIVPLTDDSGEPILTKDGKKQYRLLFASDLEK